MDWTSPFYTIKLEIKNLNFSAEDHTFYYNGKRFDLKEKKSKHFYSLLISKKAKPPTAVSKLKSEFHLSEDELKTAFTLPHNVALKPYVKAFQFKILNSILFANIKLFKIGYIDNDKCTFCKTDVESLHHLFFDCKHVKLFLERI